MISGSDAGYWFSAGFGAGAAFMLLIHGLWLGALVVVVLGAIPVLASMVGKP